MKTFFCRVYLLAVIVIWGALFWWESRQEARGQMKFNKGLSR